jgi:hypothetical protein
MVELKAVSPPASTEIVGRQRRREGAKMAEVGPDSVDAAKLFDYEAVAELFPARNQKFKRAFARYRRFDRAAEALRFAMEEMSPKSLAGAWLEVEEERFDADAMRRLYNSTEFPLARRRPTQAR